MSEKTETVRFCASNLFRHGYSDHLIQLKELGADVEIVGCMNYCGECRSEAYFKAKGEIVKFCGRNDLLRQLKERNVLELNNS